MWGFLSVSTLLLAAVVAVLVRQIVLTALYRVRTREPETLREIRLVVDVLRGDCARVQLVTARDRTRNKARVRKVLSEAENEARRKKALEIIRDKMADTLRQRREQRALQKKTQKKYTFW